MTLQDVNGIPCQISGAFPDVDTSSQDMVDAVSETNGAVGGDTVGSELPTKMDLSPCVVSIPTSSSRRKKPWYHIRSKAKPKSQKRHAHTTSLVSTSEPEPAQWRGVMSGNLITVYKVTWLLFELLAKDLLVGLEGRTFSKYTWQFHKYSSECCCIESVFILSVILGIWNVNVAMHNNGAFTGVTGIMSSVKQWQVLRCYNALSI